jgi:hypothetical protein
MFDVVCISSASSFRYSTASLFLFSKLIFSHFLRQKKIKIRELFFTKLKRSERENIGKKGKKQSKIPGI